jgi:hypothetical protein
MKPVYFLVILIFLAFLIEILSIALKVTGMDIRKARFQVISMLTNTGFTTREAELITQHPVRRKIAEAVMLISYVGTATIISLLITLMESAFSVEQLVMFLAVLAMTVYFLRNRWLLYRFEKIVEKQITKKMLKRQRYRPVEEVLNLNDEYGVAEFVVEENSKLTGKTLLESGLKQRFIQVLNIDKGDKIIHFPRTDYVFYPGDKVLVYGQIDNIKKLVSNLNSEAEE